MAPRLGRSPYKRRSLDMLAGALWIPISLTWSFIPSLCVWTGSKPRLEGPVMTREMFQV